MNQDFYVVFCKTRKKFDKYVKVNRVRNKVIVDIKSHLDDDNIRLDEHRQYFNLLIYTRIIHSLKKGKDIYYIPNFYNKDIDLDEVYKIKSILPDGVRFNILLFFDEFRDEPEISESVLSNFDLFDTSQVIKDY